MWNSLHRMERGIALAAVMLCVLLVTGCKDSTDSSAEPASKSTAIEAAPTESMAAESTAMEAAPADAMATETMMPESTSAEPAAADATAMAEKAPYPLDVCVVSGGKLGAMGDPVIYDYEGREVRFCCTDCVKKFNADPAKYLAKLDAAIAQAKEAAKTPADSGS